jgi:hypothetical protein
MDLLQNDKHIKQLQWWINIDYWSRVLLILYILTMPFVSAFAFTATISLPLIFAVFLFMIMGFSILKSGKLPKGFLGFDILIITLFFFFDIFSFVLNGWGNSKSLNHTVAYIASFALFYVIIKFTLFNIKDKDQLFKKVLKFITYTTIISALYGNVEFISSNVFGVNLNDYLPRPSEGEEYYSAYVLGLFYRARGFETESGVFTQLLELFSPMAVYFMFFSKQCNWFKIIKIFFTVSMIFSILFAASGATFIILPVAIIISLLIHVKKVFWFLAKRSIAFYFRIISVSILVLILNSYLHIYEAILLTITLKLDSNSFDDRQNRIDFFFNEFSRFNFINKIIGSGPAGSTVMGFDDTATIISLYFNVTFELGFIGLILLLMLILYGFANTLLIKSKIKFFLLISIISGSMHYSVVHNFWVPWFWFIIVFAIFCNKTLGGKIYLHEKY